MLLIERYLLKVKAHVYVLHLNIKEKNLIKLCIMFEVHFTQVVYGAGIR